MSAHLDPNILPPLDEVNFDEVAAATIEEPFVREAFAVGPSNVWLLHRSHDVPGIGQNATRTNQGRLGC